MTRWSSERKLLLDAVGLALVVMYRNDPALAGRYLDMAVEFGFATPEQAMTLMDELRALPAGTTQGDE